MSSNEQDQLYVVNPTSEKFEVKWGGYPYSLAPGQKVIWPRFIAEHFAKHLTDKILLQREKAHKDKTGTDKPFLNHKTIRPETVNTILVGTYQLFRKEKSADPNAQVAALIAQLNGPKEDEGKAIDMGIIETDKANGVVEDPEEEETSHAPTEVVTEPSEDPVDAMKRTELYEEAKKLGLKPKFGATNDELKLMIRNF